MIRLQKMYASSNDNPVPYECKFTADTEQAKKYFLFDMHLRFAKEERIKFKQLLDAGQTNFVFNNAFSKTFYDFVANSENKMVIFKRHDFKPTVTLQELLQKIDEFVNTVKPSKIGVYINTSESMLSNKDGRGIREYLLTKYSREDSPISFTFMKWKRKTTYMELVGISEF